MMDAHDRRKDQRGQTLVLVALILVGLVAFLALILDLGNVYFQRRAMQNAADAGALAGARALALEKSTATIQAAVQEYCVQRNGAQSYAMTIVSPTITVTASRTFDTYFASVVGVPTFTVTATARGKYGFPRRWRGGLMPMVIHKDAITTKNLVEIWDDDKMASDHNAGIIADGERGWLNFNGGSVSDTELVTWITNGWNGVVNIGDWINGTPGAKTSALHAMDVVRVNTTVFIPVFDTVRPGVNGSGSLDYRIVAFAAFYVTQVVDTGNPKFVKGRFERYIATEEIGGTVDTGVRVIVLSG